jgi:hypothetical protein
MRYIKKQDGGGVVFPYTIAQLKSDNPNTSFPIKLTEEALASYGVYPVSINAKPTWDAQTEKAVLDGTPTESNGSWSLGWSVVSLSQVEQDKELSVTSLAMRNRRNQVLAATDWWAVQDRTMTQAEKDYRQALRDITAHTNWPDLSVSDWPVKP